VQTLRDKFPAMTEDLAFLMKDLVLLEASFYVLRQDVLRTASASIDDLGMERSLSGARS
jgi:hypothetical protein